MGTVPRGRKDQAIDDGDWDWDEKRDLDAIVETLGWRGGSGRPRVVRWRLAFARAQGRV